MHLVFRGKSTFSLKQFILKQEVKNLYRDFLRTVRQIEDRNHREELLQWIRTDFRNNSHQEDEIVIKMLLQHGRRSLKELQSSVALAK